MGFITVRYWYIVFFLGDIFSMIYYREYFFSGGYFLQDLSLGMFFGIFSSRSVLLKRYLETPIQVYLV